ncbi:hypothetical protein B0H12DRAFT_1158892, partial [Mycena haematopus]
MQSSSLLHSQSFHPIFKTNISAPGHENCTLNLHYELPPMVFVDPYELSNRADAYSFKYAGPSNLELPVFALSDGDENYAVLLLAISQPLSADVRASLRQVRSSSHNYPGPMRFLPALTYPAESQLLPSMRTEFAAVFDKAVTVRLSPPLNAVPLETIRTPV